LEDLTASIFTLKMEAVHTLYSTSYLYEEINCCEQTSKNMVLSLKAPPDL
jgi:hypothetical protein